MSDESCSGRRTVGLLVEKKVWKCGKLGVCDRETLKAATGNWEIGRRGSHY